jgi:hypothetical protein
MTYAFKRKRAASRVLRNIEWMLRKIYNGWHFEKTEQELLYDRAWYEAQHDYQCNVFTGYWRPGKVISMQHI